ncbi:hypothetical protein ScalyP_jg7510, partial [Parmales sp. scaly parma]
MGRTRKLTFSPPPLSHSKSSSVLTPNSSITENSSHASIGDAPGPRFLRKTNSTEQQATAEEAAAAMQAEFIFEELTDQQKFDQMKTKFDGKGSHSQA